jgi:hypothetical protein
MRCQEAFEALSAELDGELGADERPVLRRHLGGCDPCRRRRQELQMVNLQLRAVGAATRIAVRMPEALRARIEQRCQPPQVFNVRWTLYTLAMALTGASALGALLVLALRPATRPAADEAKNTRNETETSAGRDMIRGVVTAGSTTSPTFTAGTGLAPRPAAAAAACPAVTSPAVVVLDVPPEKTPNLPPVTVAVDRCGLAGRLVALEAGQTVELANQDQQPHELTVVDPAGNSHTQTLPAGDRLARRLERPGTYRLLCDGAPEPCGHLVAVEHPHFAVTDAEGRYQIAGAWAPANNLTAWRPGFAPQSFPLSATSAAGAGVATALTLRPDTTALLTLGSRPANDNGGLAINDCRAARQSTSPVARACAQGGVRQAKLVMRALVKQAKERGLRLQCDSCHRDDADFSALTDDARTRFSELLAATGT